MKYIVCEVRHDGEPLVRVPFVFPDMLVHSMVFEQMRALLSMQYFKNNKKTEVVAYSAGELSSFGVLGDAGMCGGKSTSLGVESKGKEDDQLMRMADYGSCVAL